MTNELRTNDEPQRILLEASERIKACYPAGTRVEARIAGQLVRGRVCYDNLGHFDVFDEARREWRHFSPAVHPHRVLP
jgi:hypothetical protein